MRKAIRALSAVGVGHGISLQMNPYGAGAQDAAVETLSSPQKDFVFEVRKGQGSKVIKGFDARAGQKIRLVGFGAMSLDQLRAELKVDAGGALLDIGNGQQLGSPEPTLMLFPRSRSSSTGRNIRRRLPMISMRSVWIWKTVSQRACGEPILAMEALTAGR